MALYGFHCKCGMYIEVERPMADATQPLVCRCGKQMSRVYHTPLVYVRPSAGQVMDKVLSGEEVPTGWSKEKSMMTAKSMVKDKGRSLGKAARALGLDKA